jgi:hypothetical protein
MLVGRVTLSLLSLGIALVVTALALLRVVRTDTETDYSLIGRLGRLSTPSLLEIRD